MDYGSIAAGMGLGALGSALGGLGAWVVSRDLRLRLEAAEEAREFAGRFIDQRAAAAKRDDEAFKNLQEMLNAAHATIDQAVKERDAAKRAVTAAEEGLAETVRQWKEEISKREAAEGSVNKICDEAKKEIRKLEEDATGLDSRLRKTQEEARWKERTTDCRIMELEERNADQAKLIGQHEAEISRLAIMCRERQEACDRSEQIVEGQRRIITRLREEAGEGREPGSVVLRRSDWKLTKQRLHLLEMALRLLRPDGVPVVGRLDRWRKAFAANLAKTQAMEQATAGGGVHEMQTAGVEPAETPAGAGEQGTLELEPVSAAGQPADRGPDL
jgi:hypothetical protein